MAFRFMRISVIQDYDMFRPFLATLPDVDAMSYEALLEAFLARRNAYSHGLQLELARLGCETMEVVASFPELQRKWAEANGASWGKETWRSDIVDAQIRHFKPDVIFSDNFAQLPKALLEDRNRYPFVRLLAAQQGFPMFFDELRSADVVFTCCPSLKRIFRFNGVNAEHVNYSFDPGVLHAAPDKTAAHGFVFSGHSGYGLNWHHRTRYTLLRYLLEHSALECWLTERDMTLNPHMESPLAELFPHRVQSPVFGLDMYRLFRSAQVVLNMHTDATYGHAGNMRLYEATGVGACLLTNHALNIHELFEPDVEVVTYRSAEECAEKAAWLLEHPETCEAIGARAAQRVQREHLASHRAAQLFGLLRERLASPS